MDEFEKYLTTRGENASDQARAAKNSGSTKRAQNANAENKAARKEQASGTKDGLQNAVDDLNRTTNRLRRQFDARANYLETKVQMEQVLDSSRRVNQAMTKGNKSTQGRRLLDAFTREYQRSGALLQPDPHGPISENPRGCVAVG